jgi:hypothetical protein
VSFILDALKTLGKWIWDGLVAIGNAIFRALTWFFKTVFVDPITALFNFILNKIREKLKGIIFIVITIPSMIREIRELMHKPSLKGVAKLFIKPLIGFAVSELAYAVISPFLFPVSISPPTIPTFSPLPPAPTPPPVYVDTLRIDEITKFETYPRVKLSDTITLSEFFRIELYKRLVVSDATTLSDLIYVELYGRSEFVDVIGIGELLTIELYSRFTPRDVLTISDMLAVTYPTLMSVSETISISDSLTQMYPSLLELSDLITIADTSTMGTATLYALADQINTYDTLNTVIYLLVSEWTINYDNKIRETPTINTISGVISTLSNKFNESPTVTTQSGVLNDYSNKFRTVVSVSGA